MLCRRSLSPNALVAHGGPAWYARFDERFGTRVDALFEVFPAQLHVQIAVQLYALRAPTGVPHVQPGARLGVQLCALHVQSRVQSREMWRSPVWLAADRAA